MNPPAPRTRDVAAAAAVLKRGGLVAFPTETVYGLGAVAFDALAVARIFEAKQRPAFDPLIVHVALKESVSEVVADVPASARRLMDRFWPGPLTLVLPKTSHIPDIVTSGLSNVGIRMPDHEVARQLIEQTGRPIAAPSANLFGRTSPTTADHVAEQLANRIDLILDAGPCRVGLESTVVDMTTTPPTLLRHGAVTQEQLESELGRLTLRTHANADKPAASPGLLDRHYAPATPLRLWNLSEKLPACPRLGLLSVLPVDAPPGFEQIEVLSAAGSLTEAAAELFSALRRLDASAVSLILVIPGPEAGLGRAINDRLRRAAAPPS